MVETIIAICVVAVVVAGLFLVVWWVDARRSKDVGTDDARLDTDSRAPQQGSDADDELHRPSN